MFLRKLIFIALLFVPCVAHAGIGEKDAREYVDWAQPPYNKVVYLRTGENSHCTAQYFAPDIIVTARHCVVKTDGFDNNAALGKEYEIQLHDGRKTSVVLEKYGDNLDTDDWALLRVQDVKFFSTEFFAEPRGGIGFPAPVMGLGFGWLRILSDDEISRLRWYLNDMVRMPMGSDVDKYMSSSAELLRELSLVVDHKSLMDWDEKNQVYRLKVDKTCSITGMFNGYNFRTECDGTSGNSGGAISNRDGSVLYGISSASKSSFDARGNYLTAVAFNRLLRALSDMKALSPQVADVPDIIAGRKTWNVQTTLPESNDDTASDETSSAETVVTHGDGLNLISADNIPREEDLILQKEELDELETSVAERIRQYSDEMSDKEVLDILSDFVLYHDKLEEYEQAKQAYEEAKQREQSLANRLISGVAIGAGGIGGMQLASALAEQRADADAERDMAAYLATFRCDYGAGRNISGGEVNVQLPGANVLLPLYNEYTTLAADLKTRKEALGMAPGIESEVILDAATSGLYDNAATGITEGAYTSISRALMNSNGADAAEWAAQTEQTAQQVKTGGTVAGAGLGVGLVGNIAENVVHNAQSNKNESQK